MPSGYYLPEFNIQVVNAISNVTAVNDDDDE